MRLALIGLLMLAPAPLPATDVQVVVTNVRGTSGRVHVDLCTPAEFLKTCRFVAEAPARIGTTTVTLAGVPPGRYAVQASYDENGNGHVDRGAFGIPQEGVGFSNDAPIRFGPPRFEAAAFTVGSMAIAVRLRLRYFVGPNAPG